MYSVYKYTLNDLASTQELTLPKESKFLKASMQHNKITLWYLVDLQQVNKNSIKHTIHVKGTGSPSSKISTMKYLDTVFNGPYVWHLFQSLEGN